MGNLIIKPATGLGNSLKIQDQAGQECFTTIDDGGSFTNKVNFASGMTLDSPTITGTMSIPTGQTFDSPIITGTPAISNIDVKDTLITTSTTNSHIGFDKGITEKIGTGTASGTTVTVDLSTGNFFEVNFASLSGNVTTFTINNPNATSGQVNNFVLKCKQHGSSNKDFSWGSLSAIDWPEQTGPEMTQIANRYDIYSFTSYNNGSNWLGAVVGQDYSY